VVNSLKRLQHVVVPVGKGLSIAFADSRRPDLR
jgi:hypothetical protein